MILKLNCLHINIIDSFFFIVHYWFILFIHIYAKFVQLNFPSKRQVGSYLNALKISIAIQQLTIYKKILLRADLVEEQDLQPFIAVIKAQDSPKNADSAAKDPIWK